MMMREFPVSKLFELEKSFRQKQKSPLHYGFLGGEPDMLFMSAMKMGKQSNGISHSPLRLYIMRQF